MSSRDNARKEAVAAIRLSSPGHAISPPGHFPFLYLGVALNFRGDKSNWMVSRVEELQERVIDLQLEFRRLEAKRRKLKRRIDSELDKLLRAKETLKRNRTICV